MGQNNMQSFTLKVKISPPHKKTAEITNLAAQVAQSLQVLIICPRQSVSLRASSAQFFHPTHQMTTARHFKQLQGP